MNITFLVHDIHFGGGGERVAITMANHYAAKGYNITILSISKSQPENIFEIDKRVILKYLDINLNKKLKVVSKIESLLAVRKYFQELNCSAFILGIGTYPTLLVAMLPSRKKFIKIGCQHGSYESVKHLWAVLRWIFFRRLDSIISLTNYDVPNLSKLNKSVFVIPNSIPFFPDQYAKLTNKVIVSIGRIDYPKGYDLLLEVFSRFCLTNKDWKLRIIGDGPLLDNIKNIITDKGLTDRIMILPSSNMIINEYLNASIYLMTSRTEGLPMVLLEAQACGVPIISFNCKTGPSDIVNNGKDGYLIDNFDINEMSKRLTELCADLEKRIKFGENARENVKKFYPSQVFTKWDILFDHYKSTRNL